MEEQCDLYFEIPLTEECYQDFVVRHIALTNLANEAREQGGKFRLGIFGEALSNLEHFNSTAMHRYDQSDHVAEQQRILGF